MTQTNENILTTPRFRISYPKLYKPELNTLNNKMEFSTVALFTLGEDLTKMKNAAMKVMVDKFGPDQKLWPILTRNPFRDQKDKAKRDEKTGEMIMPDGHVAGAIFMNFKTQHRPAIVGKQLQPILDESLVYPGIWAIANVNPYYFDQKGNKGVAFGLNAIQIVAEGEPLSGRPAVEEMFAPIEGATVATGDGSATSMFG